MIKLKNDEGLSFVETVISLFILSIIMIVLFRLGTSLVPSLTDDRIGILKFRNDLLVDRIIENNLAKIEPPWWIPDYSIEEKNNEWELNWNESSEESLLIFYIDEDELFLKIDESIEYNLGLCDNFNISIIYDDSNYPILYKIIFNDKIRHYPIKNRTTPGKTIETLD